MTITATFQYENTIPEFVHQPFREHPDHPLERLAKAVLLRALADLKLVRQFFAEYKRASKGKKKRLTERFYSTHKTTPMWLLLELEAFFNGNGLEAWCRLADWDPQVIRRAWTDPTILEQLQ